MSIYTVDVYSGSSDSIIRDSHAQGVIVKATQGTGYVNPLCNHQWDLAGSLDKLRGLYHYAGGGNPENEAQYFINNIRNYVGKGILILDWESYQNASWGSTTWARRFVEKVHALTGVWPLIYVQESALWQVANCASVCGVWVAKYASMNWNSWTLPNMSVAHGSFAALTGWQYTGGDMDRSIFYIDAAAWNRLANPSGANQGWSKTNGKWQYVDKSGHKLSGWQQINGRWYFFDATGNAATGWQQINDKWYYMDPQNAWCLIAWQQIDGHWFYFDPENAWLLSGWQKINNLQYYLNPNHDGMFGAALTGWQEHDGKKYYFDPDNCWAVTGKQKIGGKEYVFDASGVLQADKPEKKPMDQKPATIKLSDDDRKQIEEELKPYIDSQIDAKLKR